MTPPRLPSRHHVAVCALCLAPLVAFGANASSTDIEDLEALLNKPVYAASKFAQDAADAPAAVTVLTAGDIRAFGWRTLAEILNGVRSVHLRGDRNYDYVGVRGFARAGDYSSRLLVLIDGMRVNDNIYGQAGVGREFPLDIALIERVEFIPGPGSALYGSNAVLGVVNIVTRSAASLRGGAAALEIGADSSRLLSVAQGLELGDARLLVAGRAENRPGRDRYFAEFDAPETNFGVARGADRETDRKFYAKLTQGDFTLASLLSERRKQIPNGLYDTAFPSQDTRGADRYGFVDAQWQHALAADGQIFLRATLAQYDFDGSYDYRPADGVQRLNQRGRWVNLEARWQYEGWRDQRIVFGAEAQRNLQQRQRSAFDGTPAGTLADVDTASQRWGLFVNDEITVVKGLRAVLGARLDRQLDGRISATPRVALLWEPAPELVVKLLDGRAYREPNAYESQYTDNTIAANPGLRSETLRATELALDWRALPNLRLAASAFRYRVVDLIEQQLNFGAGKLAYQNAGAVNARGVEFEADYVDPTGWRLRSSWVRQRTRNDGSGAQIDNSPTSLGKLNLSVPVPAWQSRAGVEWQRIGERLTPSGARLPTHAVTNLTWQIVPPGSRLSLAASVYNLFDTAYADPGAPELRQDSIPHDRRKWRVQLALQF